MLNINISSLLVFQLIWNKLKMEEMQKILKNFYMLLVLRLAQLLINKLTASLIRKPPMYAQLMIYTEPLFSSIIASRIKLQAKKALDVIKRALAADPNVGRMTEYFQQLEIVWKEILYMCLASVLITVVYIFLLKWITKPLLYVSMLIILIMFVLLGAWSW